MQELYNVLGAIMRFFYELVQQVPEPEFLSHYAMAIMLMAIFAKILTMPLTLKSAKASQKMAEVKPELDELKKKFGYDERILQQKTMEYYKENNINQMGCSSCLPQIINLVIILALFNVMRNPELYIFDDPSKLQEIQRNFFWIPDLILADPFWFGLPLINTASQILMTKLNPSTQQSAAAGGQTAQSMMLMQYGMPIMFFFLFLNFSSGLLLYWAFGNVVEIVIRLIMRIFLKNKTDDDANLRRA